MFDLALKKCQVKTRVPKAFKSFVHFPKELWTIDPSDFEKAKALD